MPRNTMMRAMTKATRWFQEQKSESLAKMLSVKMREKCQRAMVAE